MFMEHSGNWNIAANTLWYWYKVYPGCINDNPVPQKIYRIEVIVIQKFLNYFNNLNTVTCQVVTFKWPIQDRQSSFRYTGICKVDMVFQVCQHKEQLSLSQQGLIHLNSHAYWWLDVFHWSSPGIQHTYPCMADCTSGKCIHQCCNQSYNYKRMISVGHLRQREVRWKWHGISHLRGGNHFRLVEFTPSQVMVRPEGVSLSGPTGCIESVCLYQDIFLYNICF